MYAMIFYLYFCNVIFISSIISFKMNALGVEQKLRSSRAFLRKNVKSDKKCYNLVIIVRKSEESS